MTIPNVTNKPTIGAATTALAKSVEVQSGAVLTISSSATLAVNGSKNLSGSTTAFYNIGTVHNNGQLNLGNTASTGEHGLSNRATFNNNAGGTITIDRSGFGGLENGGGNFTNAGGISIGATANVGFWGLRNIATFNNQALGTITLDRSTTHGLQNVAGTFTNAGGITIGVIESVGANGIQNAANFANNGCTGIIRIVSNSIINNFTDVTNTSTGNFTNSGTIIENATGNSNISSNSGLVQNLNGGAFNIGSGTPATTSLALIWTGCTSTDWNTASNWNLVRVTTATDDVIIPNVTNKPILGAGTSAVAKSVKVESGASLTILATGSLTINGSGGTYGLGNFGTVVNSGSVIIGNTAAVGPTGLVNYGTFSNNAGGTITIDRSTNDGLLTKQGSDFVNAGVITIGATAAVGSFGLVNQGTFSNQAGGTITIDRSTSDGLFNQAGYSDNAGIFTNAGVITIGATAAVGDHGLLNGWIFKNQAGGTITIDRSTKVGLVSGNNGTFTNAGGITIGAIAAVGANGIQNFAYFYNNGCTGIIRIVSNSTIDNQGIFTNSGTISENATGNSNISSNSGLVQNLNGGTFTIPSNTGLLTTALTTNLAIAPAPSLTINTGQTATLTASGAISYLWSTGETTASISVSVAGPYSVTGTTGSCSATATVSLIVNLAPPIITSQPVGPTMVCLGGSVSVPVGVTNATSFQWITSTTPGSVQMAVAGQTSATLTLTNLQSTDAGYYYLSVTGPGGSTVSNGFSLMPIQPPLAFIAANPSLTITQGQSTMLTASGAQNFLWSTGDTSPAIPVSVAGPYSVTVSASGSGCFGSKTVTVTVLPCDLSVGVTPSGSTLTCTTPTVSLTASGGGTYRWNDNSTSAIRSVNSAGTYSVTVTSANGCTASASATITEDKTPPTLNLTASRTTLTCTNPSAALTASGAGTVQWSNTTTDATLTVSAAGLYSVTLTGANGCSSTASLNIVEDKAPPTLNLTASGTTLTCTNPSATLTASGAGTVRWSDNSTSPTLTVSAAGLYSVTLTGANGCISTASLNVNQDIAAPTLTLTIASSVCEGQPISLLATAGLTNYIFSGPGTIAGLGNARTVTGLAAGSYSFTVTAAQASNGCSGSATASATVNATPGAPTLTALSRTVTASTTPFSLLPFVQATSGNTLSFSATSGVLNPPNANISTAGVQSFSVTQANGSCVSPVLPFSLTVTPGITQPPLTQTVCKDSRVILTVAVAGAVSYRWFETGQSASSQMSDKNGVQLGTATASLTLVSMQSTSNYYCRVTLGDGSIQWYGQYNVTVNKKCNARLGSEEPEVALLITLLPNPIENGQLRAIVGGAAGQPLTVQLHDIGGYVIRQQHYPQADEEQRVEWNVASQPTGMYLLRAVSNGQQQTVKVVKP